MDFSTLISRINKEHFSDGKKGELKSYQGYFSASEVVQVIKAFPHASDQVEALKIMEPRLGVLSGQDGKTIVEAFTFNKLDVVEIIANHINDQANKYLVLDAISFHFDKEKARKILDDARPVSCPQGAPATNYPAPGGGPPPTQKVINIQLNPLDPLGVFSAANAALGSIPPPQGGPGNYPSQQQGAPGNYPPQQGPPGNYHPQQGPPGNYPPQQGAPGNYPPPPQQTNYPPPTSNYPPPPQGNYPPPAQTNYPPPAGGNYPPPPQGGGYPAPGANYPPPPQGTNYPPPPQGSGYPPPPQQGAGYPPPQQGAGYPPPPQGGGYPAAGGYPPPPRYP